MGGYQRNSPPGSHPRDAPPAGLKTPLSHRQNTFHSLQNIPLETRDYEKLEKNNNRIKTQNHHLVLSALTFYAKRKTQRIILRKDGIHFTNAIGILEKNNSRNLLSPFPGMPRIRIHSKLCLCSRDPAPEVVLTKMRSNGPGDRAWGEGAPHSRRNTVYAKASAQYTRHLPCMS